MTAFNQDQRFALVLILSLAAGSCLFDLAQAQALTPEDRLSVLKFVGAFMNFLDLELENSTTAAPVTTNATATAATTVETTALTSSGNSTEVTTESAVTSNSTTIVDSSSSTGSTDPGTTTTTEATRTTVRRRMCFKRFCYKFGGDKGYIV